ncbi:MAG: hypothetical protein VX624_05385, partial [Pseudomonadota bacterium]|nr:hypothetical protein [Pseudomonadota bacterium]
MGRTVAFVLSFGILGCAAPVKKTAPPPTVLSLAPTPQAASAGQRAKSFIILGQTALPDEDALENAFAKQTIVVDVGPSAGGTQMSLPGVVCTASQAERPTTVPKSIVPESHDPHGLSADETKALEATSHVFKLTCSPDDGLNPRQLLPLAEVAAGTLAQVTQGWLHDVDTGRYWPRAQWMAARESQSKYAPARAYRILMRQSDDGQTLVYTKGLAAFGRPEIGLFPVEPSNIERVQAVLPFLADLSLDEPTAEGQRISYADQDSLLISADAYLKTYKGTANLERPSGLLILSAPSLFVGDAAA